MSRHHRCERCNVDTGAGVDYFSDARCNTHGGIGVVLCGCCVDALRGLSDADFAAGAWRYNRQPAVRAARAFEAALVCAGQVDPDDDLVAVIAQVRKELATIVLHTAIDDAARLAAQRIAQLTDRMLRDDDE